MVDEEGEGVADEDRALLARREATHERRLQLFATLERRIGIPEGFFWALHAEPNDWAYVVKLSVVCEAAVTHLLVLSVGDGRLQEHFGDLTQARRLELTKQLGLLSDADRHTLSAIAQIRNAFAHRVENLSGSLQDFFLRRTQDQKIELLTKLVQLEGQDKPKATDDLSGHAQFFRLQLFACCMRPIESIANFGLAADERARAELDASISELQQ